MSVLVDIWISEVLSVALTLKASKTRPEVVYVLRIKSRCTCAACDTDSFESVSKANRFWKLETRTR